MDASADARLLEPHARKAPAAAAPTPGPRRRGPKPALEPANPVLARLAQGYPALFGARLLPLKRGILQDLLDAHPGELSKTALKAALAQHTRSTRYLSAVASGLPRHDLSGQAVEPLAPEHRHHALLELYRRRQARSGQDLSAELRQRIVQAAHDAGLSALDYAQRVRSANAAGDAAAEALLDEAMAELAQQQARDRALLQAFEASGLGMTAFADAHGLHPLHAAAAIERARRLMASPPPAAPPAAETA